MISKRHKLDKFQRALGKFKEYNLDFEAAGDLAQFLKSLRPPSPSPKKARRAPRPR